MFGLIVTSERNDVDPNGSPTCWADRRASHPKRRLFREVLKPDFLPSLCTTEFDDPRMLPDLCFGSINAKRPHSFERGRFVFLTS